MSEISFRWHRHGSSRKCYSALSIERSLSVIWSRRPHRKHVCNGMHWTIVIKFIMQQFFLPNWLKVVSSWLLQYKPVCVTNFDKLCRKMLKKITSLLVFLVFFGYFRHVWRHTRIRLFCLRCYALLRLDKLFILPVCVLRTYNFYVVMHICCVMSQSTFQ